MDRHQVIEQDRPGSSGSHSGDSLQISLARLADLDLPLLLALLGRQVREVLVLDLIAEHAAEQRDRPSGTATPATQLALALEPRVFGHHRPGTAQRAVTLPPRGRQLA